MIRKGDVLEKPGHRGDHGLDERVLAAGVGSGLEEPEHLARDEKTNRKGMPNPFRLAVIAKAHFADVRLPFPPAWMQRTGLALGAPLGRLLGYRPAYHGKPDTSRPQEIAAAA